MIDDILSLERRAFLQQAAGAVAVATVSNSAVAAGEESQRTLVLYQQRDAASVAFATEMQAKGLRTLPLGDDVVRLWRDQLQHLVIEQGYRLMGRTQYADYFVLRGLAAEERIFPQHDQQQSNSSFDWLI